MITRDEIEERISTFLYHHLKRDVGVSEMLRRCIQREYEDDRFSMRKRMDSPFADSVRFQLHADYNRYDFMYGEFDFFDHIETFAATALPRKDFENVCVAAVYPLPNRIGTNWVRGADGQYTDAGKANHTKGSFSWAILYYNGDLPEMDWEPSPVDDSYPHAHTYDTQKAMWDEERSGAREISAYWRDTQLPFDCRTYQERLKKGIPLTEYQQRVVDAGGWPYGNIGITGTNTDAEDAGASGEAADASATGGEWEGSVRTHGASGPDSSTAYQEPPPASPPTNPLAGINIEPLLAHCLKHRDKWKESENPAHHTRWNHVINLIELGGRDFNAARAYAKTHASKGWKPWRELADMLGRV